MILSKPLQEYTVWYYRFRFLNGSILSLNGKMGIGKSTMGKALEHFLNAQGFHARFFPEDFDSDYLDLYLLNRKQYAFGFQKDTLNRRMAIHREAEAFAASGGIAIIDRDIYGDMAFARKQVVDGFINPIEWAIYEKEIVRACLHRPTFMIHLLCDPTTALDRVHLRGLADKDAYSEADMISFEDAQVGVLTDYYTGPLLRLDWSRRLSASGMHDLSASGNTKVEITEDILIDVLYQLKECEETWAMTKIASLKTLSTMS